MNRELFTVMLFITFIVVYVVNQYVIIKRETNRISSYALHLSTPLDSNITEVLDNLCTECLNDYLVLSAELFDIQYINEETEKKIQYDLLKIVMDRISPAFIDRLSIYYNPSSINDLITTKVVIAVTGYVVNINKIKK